MKKVAQRAEGGKGVEGKKAGKIDLKKLFRLGVLGALLLASVVGAGAEQRTSKVKEVLDPVVASGNTYVRIILEDNSILEITNPGRPFIITVEILKSLRTKPSVTYEDANMGSEWKYKTGDISRLIAINGQNIIIMFDFAANGRYTNEFSYAYNEYKKQH